MKTLFAIVATVLLGVAGCGSPAETCQTTNCGTGAKTYETCARAGTTHVTYNFGGDSCSCDAATQDCTDCATKVANYCSM